MATETIRMTPTQTLEVRLSTPEALKLNCTWDTSPKPPPTHWHPTQHEHFEVVAGELTVEVGGEGARVLRTGHNLLRHVRLVRLANGVLRPTKAAADELETVRRLRSWFGANEFHTMAAERAVALVAARGPLEVPIPHRPTATQISQQNASGDRLPLADQ